MHDVAPLAPDLPRYIYFEQQGMLRIMTARSSGKLVGYATICVLPHLHHLSTVFASVDTLWLRPDYRSGWTGARMIRHIERNMKKLGAAVVQIASKVHYQADRGGTAKLLEHLGYRPTEVSYAKVLK